MGATGYIEGPCFAFDAEIRHGMSGGPLFSPSGVVRGVNSAGVSQFFGEPMSLGSLLHPMLSIRLKFGAQLGPLRINADHRVIDHSPFFANLEAAQMAFAQPLGHCALVHLEALGDLRRRQ